ncbi:MAG: type II toxin-antitoxin system HicA family toxin [Flavobacteriaceae bacterium]
MKVRTILKMLHKDGWVQVRQRGSHRQFKHPVKKGTVTVAGKPSHDLAPFIEKSILRQARIKKEK